EPAPAREDREDSVSTRYVTHRVLENETLFSLAKKYNTTVEKLRELNRLGPFEGIKYNQRLVVPYSDAPEDNWVEDEAKQPVLMPKKETAANATPPGETKIPASAETKVAEIP